MPARSRTATSSAGRGCRRRRRSACPGRLAVVARQLGLRVERVHRAGPALHEQPDDRARLRGVVRRPGAMRPAAVDPAPASRRSRPSRSASASMPNPGAGRRRKSPAIGDPRRRRGRIGSWSRSVHRAPRRRALVNQRRELVEREEHVASRRGHRGRRPAARNARAAASSRVARRAAQSQLVGAARSAGGSGPGLRGRARARSRRSPRTNGSFSSARFWVGTAVVLRRPHVAVESGASNISANGFGDRAFDECIDRPPPDVGPSWMFGRVGILAAGGDGLGRDRGRNGGPYIAPLSRPLTASIASRSASASSRTGRRCQSRRFSGSAARACAVCATCPADRPCS